MLNSAPGVTAAAGEDIDEPVVHDTGAGAAPRLLEGRQRVPVVGEGVEDFAVLRHLRLRSHSPYCQDEPVFYQGQGYVEAAHLHWLLRNPLQIFVYLCAIFSHLVSAHESTNNVYVVVKSLDGGEETGDECLGEDGLLDEALGLEVEQVDVGGAWLQEVDARLVLVHVLLRHRGERTHIVRVVVLEVLSLHLWPTGLLLFFLKLHHH